MPPIWSAGCRARLDAQDARCRIQPWEAKASLTSTGAGPRSSPTTSPLELAFDDAELRTLSAALDQLRLDPRVQVDSSFRLSDRSRR